MTLLHKLTALFLLSSVSLIHAQSDAAIPDAHLTFTTIDVPEAWGTNVLGINSAGDMVGDYATTENGPPHGFLLKDGNFAFFDYPEGDDTVPVGINDSGLISGSSFIENYTAMDSFFYDGITFTTLHLPGKTVTWANGINNAGDIVGGDGSLGGTRGFALRRHNLKDIYPPGGYVSVFGNDINNLGQVVGMADDTGFFMPAVSLSQFEFLGRP